MFDALKRCIRGAKDWYWALAQYKYRQIDHFGKMVYEIERNKKLRECQEQSLKEKVYAAIEEAKFLVAYMDKK